MHEVDLLREALEELAGAVAGIVVDDDPARRRLGLGGERPSDPLDVSDLVADG